MSADDISGTNIYKKNFIMKNNYRMSEARETARAHALIAQGHKILRKLALERAAQEETAAPPDPAVSEEKTPEIPERATRVPKSPVFEFSLSPAQFLLIPKSKAWGVNYETVLFQTLLGGKVRASPTSKLVWLQDPGSRRGWASTDQDALKAIFEQLQFFHAECKTLLNVTFWEFSKETGKVPISKFARRHRIVGTELQFKRLLKWARKEHNRLPSVCARKAPKKN